MGYVVLLIVRVNGNGSIIGYRFISVDLKNSYRTTSVGCCCYNPEAFTCSGQFSLLLVSWQRADNPPGILLVEFWISQNDLVGDILSADNRHLVPGHIFFYIPAIALS